MWWKGQFWFWYSPFLSSNIPAKPTYGVCILQLIQIGRICDNLSAFSVRHRLLNKWLFTQGFLYCMLCACFTKRYGSLFRKYGVSMKRHIWEGICIPLEARPDLKRSVTVRGRGQCAVQRYKHTWPRSLAHYNIICRNSCPTSLNRIPGLRRWTMCHCNVGLCCSVLMFVCLCGWETIHMGGESWCIIKDL